MIHGGNTKERQKGGMRSYTKHRWVIVTSGRTSLRQGRLEKNNNNPLTIFKADHQQNFLFQIT